MSETESKAAASDVDGDLPSVAGRVSALGRLLARRIDQVCAPHDLTADQWFALDVIVRHDGVAMNDLARALSIPAPTLTKCVDRLVTGALAFRLVDHADRRRVLVYAAQRGVETHKDISPAVLRAEREFFADIPTRDRQALHRSLDHFFS